MIRRAHRARAALRRLAAVTSALTACLALPAASVAAVSLSGSLGGGAKFPARTLVLSAPAGVKVDVPHMYIWENGGPVDHLSVTPINRAHAGDFGVELVIDQSASMAGAPLAHALAAARAFAAQRTGNQELGVIGFNSRPTTVLPLTSDPRAISRVLSATPWTAGGTRILPAVSLALKQLKTAGVADGAVIVLSDGAATGSANGATVQSVAAAAQLQHVPIFAVGLRDRSFRPGFLRQLAQLAGGTYAAASGAELPKVFTSIGASLTNSYLIRYQSIVPGGRHIAINVHVDGVRTLLHLGYFAQAPTGAQQTAGAKQPAGTQPATGNGPSRLVLPTTAPPGTGAAEHIPTYAQRIPGWKPAVTRHSFWTSSLGLLAVAGACALLLGLALAIMLQRHPARRAVQRRVGSFIDAAQVESGGTEQAEPTKGPLNRLLVGRRWWPGFVALLQTARITRPPLALIKRSAAIAAVAAVLVAYLFGSIVFGVIVLVASPFLVRAWVSRRARRQRKLFAEQLPTNLQDLAGAMRAGRSFVGAISAVAETSAEPMKGELERALTDERLGLPLEDTLEAVAHRMQAKDVEQIALIAALSRSSGSNVAEALERVAEGARERADLAREIRSLTGQARLSSWVLSGLPPAMLLALTFLAPQYAHPLFHTTVGIVMLGIATGMVFAGWFVMKRITDPEG